MKNRPLLCLSCPPMPSSDQPCELNFGGGYCATVDESGMPCDNRPLVTERMPPCTEDPCDEPLCEPVVDES